MTICFGKQNAPASKLRLKIRPDGLYKNQRMKADTLNPVELRAAGYKALADTLGPLGMAKFLRQFDQGHGDYTRDRKKWLRDQSVQTIAKRIRARKKSRS
jgi:hypothetical protein